MKLAVYGKGGVGKSTLSASLCLLLAERGRRVLGVCCRNCLSGPCRVNPFGEPSAGI